MIPILVLIALIAPIFGMLIYRFNGKKQIFYLDMVQFLYLAIFAPVMFVWTKTFLYVLLRSELSFSLSYNEMFIIDTAFSVISFFVFSAVAIHSMTKTFWFKRREDPKFDLYHISEYFHLWWSHIVIFAGAMMMMTLLSLANLLVPFVGIFLKWQIWSTLLGGTAFGLAGFYIIWASDPMQGNFMRIMKIVTGTLFLVHVIAYFIFEPDFSVKYGLYWFFLSVFATGTACSGVIERSPKANKLREWFLHLGWGENINIFEKRKK